MQTADLPLLPIVLSQPHVGDVQIPVGDVSLADCFAFFIVRQLLLFLCQCGLLLRKSLLLLG